MSIISLGRLDVSGRKLGLSMSSKRRSSLGNQKKLRKVQGVYLRSAHSLALRIEYRSHVGILEKALSIFSEFNFRSAVFVQRFVAFNSHVLLEFNGGGNMKRLALPRSVILGNATFCGHFAHHSKASVILTFALL